MLVMKMKTFRKQTHFTVFMLFRAGFLLYLGASRLVKTVRNSSTLGKVVWFLTNAQTQPKSKTAPLNTVVPKSYLLFLIPRILPTLVPEPTHV